ncbi:dermonecrotic toxin domain-containing protein [[Erwinia] mediterraneensis]|uniref:dermonecrotic toxin domain-containing protein n=1 Tax=[Erwinia] mediterraneensis TaxID=2161819 RepID=UPI00102F9018|nr:DUF6543 domain-containing protein [[Erwinia] mediterraneensis]
MPDAINTLAPYNHPVICDDDIYYDCIDFLPESGETAAAPALSQQCKDALLEAVKMISFAEAQVASLATLDALLKKLGLALPLHQLNVILAARQAYRQGLDISHAFSLALPALSWLQPEIIQDFALTIKNKMEEWLGESCACYLQQTQYGDRAGAVSFFLAILFLAMHYGASAATENQAETRLIKGTRWFLSLFYNVRHIWSLIAGLAETKQTASRIDDEGNIALSSQEKSVQKQEKAARKQAVIAGSLNQQQAEAAFTHHQPPVMATPPVQHAESAQAVQPEGSRFSAPVTWLDNLWRNHLTLPGVSAGVISGNPSTPDLSQFLQLATDAATVSGESVMRATEATTLSDIRFNLSAITTFQHYYQQQWPDMISYAATLLQQAVKETFDVELDPENTWLHAFLLGSNADTLTGFEHVGKPAWSRKVVTLVITGFLPEEYENEIGLKGLYGVYKQSADQASHFGKNNEAGITPAQLMDVISSLNFYQRYTEKLEEFWKTPKVQELENIINFILQAAHHFHQVTPEDQAVFFKGWGLAQNKQPEVSRHLLRFKEYYATEIIIFRHPDSPKIYLYDPRGDSPFMIFPGEFEMKSWFINRCAGEEERQKIARAFSVYDRRWGLEEGLEKVGDPQADPNDFLDDFSFTKQPVQGDLAEAMAKRQKERAWSDAENIIKKKSAIIVERLELWLQACNKVIFNPLTPVIELGIEISKIIDADSWQARKAAATRVATNATLLLLTGAVGFIEKYLVENTGNGPNLLIVFYVQIMPDDFIMQLHRF